MESRYVKKIQTFISMGKLLVSLSTCKRLQVAAIVFPCDCSMIYSIGYNGPSRGLPNDSCTEQEGRCGCVHAETNAMLKFNNNISKPSILYSRYVPCLSCASMILNCSSIKAVIYTGEYRNLDGHTLIRKAGVPIVVQDNLISIEQDLKYWKKQC